MRRTSSELKQLAKGSLLGRYALPIGAFVLYYAITVALDLLMQFFFPGTTIGSAFQYMIAACIIGLLSSLLSVGPSVILLDMSRGGNGQFQDFFYCFRHQPDRILLSQLFIGLLEGLCLLPAILMITWLAFNYRLPFLSLYTLLALLLLIVGAAVSIPISLCYALVIPLYIDCPEKSVRQLMKESRMLMRGNKCRLFYLHLSFIGLSLLSVLTCFVGLLWLVPYMEMTTLMFYREVIGEI